MMDSREKKPGLYDPRFEHDNCGIGAVVDIQGRKTHRTIDDALQIVEHLEHRAGKDAEGKTGDGVGILMQIGHKFFTKAAAAAGISLGEERSYGIGMFFFPQEELRRNQAKKLFEIICQKEGLPFLGLPVLLLLGVDASLLSRGFSFVVSYFDENLSLMMVMSGIFAGLRIVGAIGLLRDRMWGFALSLVNCTVTLVLMVFMLPAGVADGLLSGAALVLLLMARYGSRRILD